MLAWLAVAALAQEVSGLAPSGETCLAVSDVKDAAKGQVYRLGEALAPIAGEALPVDLEAIIPFGERFLVASGSGGTFATFALADGHEADATGAPQLSVLSTVVADVRMLAVQGELADQVEGVVAMDDHAILVGTRGSKGAPGSLSVYVVADAKGRMKRVAGPVELKQPCGLDPKARSIAELARDPEGHLWAVAAEDPGDEGPFASCAYRFDVAWKGKRLTALTTGEQVPFAGDKVEGLAWCGGQPTAATDNEALAQRVFTWEPATAPAE